MQDVVITGTGLYTPPYQISNEELVHSFNAYVDAYNKQHASDIQAGHLQALLHSSAEFIVKASGIHARYVMEKNGILDIDQMRPNNLERPNEMPSLQCEMACSAAKEAMENARVSSQDIDAVLVACSNMPRPYPALAIEIQSELNIQGFAYDLNVACASAVFGIQAAVDAICNQHANTVLVVNPEICSAHLNFRDRDSHFIFGDACTAIILQRASLTQHTSGFQVLGTLLKTQFSNNIRNNFGFLNMTQPEKRNDPDKLFIQQGRKVFKEVIPFVSELLHQHLAALNLQPQSLKRLFLHQANANMNELIAKKVLGRIPHPLEAPIILDRFANTSSAGSIIAFHLHHADFNPGEYGLLSAFGAGYSAGSVILQKL